MHLCTCPNLLLLLSWSESSSGTHANLQPSRSRFFSNISPSFPPLTPALYILPSFFPSSYVIIRHSRHKPRSSVALRVLLGLPRGRGGRIRPPPCDTGSFMSRHTSWCVGAVLPGGIGRCQTENILQTKCRRQVTWYALLQNFFTVGIF